MILRRPFLFCLLLFAHPAIGETFAISMPEVAAKAINSDFEITMPTVTARAIRSDFVVTLPTISAISIQSDFVVTLPTISARAIQSDFVVTMPTVTANAIRSDFVITLPTISAAAYKDDEADAAEEQTAASNVHCTGLKQCFSDLEISRLENDLRSLGYAPESYPNFCADVSQSLGGCLAQPTGSAVSSDGNTPLPTPTPFPPPETDGDATALNFNRCPPLENYAIDLQRRGDAGEDTDAEEERLTMIIIAASKFLLQGRTDRWCKQIAENLP